MPRVALRYTRDAGLATARRASAHRVMTRGAGRYSTFRIAGKYQPYTWRLLPQTAAALRSAFTSDRQQSMRFLGQMYGDVDGVLLAQHRSDGVHGPQKSPVRTEIVQLFVDHPGVHAGQSRKQGDGVDNVLTMATGASERDNGAVLPVAGADACQNLGSPRNSRGRLPRGCGSLAGSMLAVRPIALQRQPSHERDRFAELVPRRRARESGAAYALPRLQ